MSVKEAELFMRFNYAGVSMGDQRNGMLLPRLSKSVLLSVA